MARRLGTKSSKMITHVHRNGNALMIAWYLEFENLGSFDIAQW